MVLLPNWIRILTKRNKKIRPRIRANNKGVGSTSLGL
jgi:hypothetical protein